MKNVAFIPARGGSVSIPLKNIKPLCGKPLVYWVAAAASACEEIAEVYIATDSDLIRDTVESLAIPKVHVIGRSAETATSTASSESALLEFAGNYSFDNVAFIQATSPLLTSDDLSRGFKEFARDDVESVLSVVEDKHFYWRKDCGDGLGAKELNYDVFARPRRQEFEGCFQENGAFYITSRNRLLETRNRVSGRIGLCVMGEASAFEIDEPEDLQIIKVLLSNQLKEKAIGKHQIKLFLTDCDGCLTDSGMYYDESGLELKKFNTRDGMGFSLLGKAGIKTGIITGENSSAVVRRAERLSVDYVRLGCKDKLAEVRRICDLAGIRQDEVAYVGDDLNDIELLQWVGLSFAPSDATAEVKAVVKYQLTKKGGEGAVREAIEVVIGPSAVASCFSPEHV